MTAPNFSELSVGHVVAEREIELGRDALVRYAGASGDFNPIHYRDDVATSVGLPGVLAHGMLTMGVAGSVATDWLGAAATVADFQARFTRPVPVQAEGGAPLTVTATIGALDTEARTARIDLKVVFDGSTVLGKSQLVAAFA
ncbi:MaoC family dehydratase N-terminal domain-containing protein [Leucobacter sp. CSA2]|uniref:MaoC family dehydratase N-terminal domain-containing protein n=1 Tax=Leucobacter edaphi TaxID=2796472 RepID=A0A934QD46_9MICO|nr:MaoC/PaaZ C-terminal domain-containing protein [Leucobacter edaphi]MBK0422273.1 MaoC family dehydratase N-terminal domain-containing protein [Leucobacter edaphi]